MPLASLTFVIGSQVSSQTDFVFAATWTGLTLDGNDVRVLPRDEWKNRKDRLAELGWKDPELK